MADLRAPVPARPPWLTASVNAGSAHRMGARPVAVVVPDAGRSPVAAAFLQLRRRATATVVSLLGQDMSPLPAGRPPFRLLARDDDVATELAGGVLRLLDGVRGPWRLRLAGLPLGDPTMRVFAARLPTAVSGNARSHGLVDDLDDRGRVERSRDPGKVERWLSWLLDRSPDRGARDFLRACARLHAAIGQLEVAAAGRSGHRAVLLTLVDGADRWPWWGAADDRVPPTRMGAPLVSLTATGGSWLSSAGPVSSRTGAR